MGQVYNLETLASAVERFKLAGKTVVTTNGCFDLLHVGHLRYLQQTKALGDVLIVALNSDASIQRLKGSTRPIVEQADRAELLAALNCVDGVVIFEEDTPEKVLKAIKPDIHAKGGDYTAESLPEAATLKAMGTKMAFLPVVEGKSTTSIVDKIEASVKTELLAESFV